jgi:hypothetical protein
MFGIEFGDAFEICNNYKAWQEKSFEELCVVVNKFLLTGFFEAMVHKYIYFV